MNNTLPYLKGTRPHTSEILAILESIIPPDLMCKVSNTHIILYYKLRRPQINYFNYPEIICFNPSDCHNDTRINMIDPNSFNDLKTFLLKCV